MKILCSRCEKCCSVDDIVLCRECFKQQTNKSLGKVENFCNIYTPTHIIRTLLMKLDTMKSDNPIDEYYLQQTSKELRKALSHLKEMKRL